MSSKKKKQKCPYKPSPNVDINESVAVGIENLSEFAGVFSSLMHPILTIPEFFCQNAN
jgi:hypothetical protein